MLLMLDFSCILSALMDNLSKKTKNEGNCIEREIKSTLIDFERMLLCNTLDKLLTYLL